MPDPQSAFDAAVRHLADPSSPRGDRLEMVASHLRKALALVEVTKQGLPIARNGNAVLGEIHMAETLLQKWQAR